MRGWLLSLLVFPFLIQTASPQWNGIRGSVQLNDGNYMVLADLERQDNAWSCGAHVAARVLNSHGINRSYGSLKTEALNRTQGRSQLVGLHPGTLAAMIRSAGLKAEARTLTMQELVALVKEGRPVPVLIQSPKRPGVRMHWIVLTGVDEAKEAFVFYNTDGNTARMMSFEYFERLWEMRDTYSLFKASFPLFGISTRTALILPPLENPVVDLFKAPEPRPRNLGPTEKERTLQRMKGPQGKRSRTVYR